MEILISEITIGKNRRKLGDITELAKSIEEVGLINPVTVNEDFVLIAGLHRLEACKSLGWDEIPATVLSLDDQCSQLAEIDENLIRNELSALERGEQLARRKDIYLALYPETAKGGDRKSENVKNQNAESAFCSPSFTKDTASKIGASVRQIETDVQVARITEPVRNAIRETPIADNKSELLMLSRLDESTQAQVAEIVTADNSTTVKEALREISQQPLPENFKTGAMIAAEHKQSPGAKWNKSLYDIYVHINSIRDLGGIAQLSAKWSLDHRIAYLDEIQELQKTFTAIAAELKESIQNEETLVEQECEAIAA